MNRRQKLLARMVRQVANLVRRRWFLGQRLLARVVRRYRFRKEIQSPYYQLTGRWGWSLKWAYACRE